MNWCIQTFVLIVLGGLMAWVGYLVVGEPERSVKCEQQTLEQGAVCLDTVLNDWGGEVIWVDARSDTEYKKLRVAGALFISESDVDRYLSDPNTMQQIGMAGVEGKKLVVYCATEACGSSKAIAERIRQSGLHEEVYTLHGGWKAIQSGIPKDKLTQE